MRITKEVALVFVSIATIGIVLTATTAPQLNSFVNKLSCNLQSFGDDCIVFQRNGTTGTNSTASCFNGYSLVNGICIPPTGTCPQGYTLQNGICQPPVAQCPTGFTLSHNQCIPPQGTCQTGYTLQNGVCTPAVVTCANGYTLLNGICQPPIAQCNTGYTLQNGVCIPITSSCPAGQTLVNGVCTVIIPTCQAGTVLQGNQCVPIQCPSGQTLVNGVCTTTCSTTFDWIPYMSVISPNTCPTPQDCTPQQVLDGWNLVSGVCTPPTNSICSPLLINAGYTVSGNTCVPPVTGKLPKPLAFPIYNPDPNVMSILKTYLTSGDIVLFYSSNPTADKAKYLNGYFANGVKFYTVYRSTGIADIESKIHTTSTSLPICYDIIFDDYEKGTNYEPAFTTNEAQALLIFNRGTFATNNYNTLTGCHASFWISPSYREIKDATSTPWEGNGGIPWNWGQVYNSVGLLSIQTQPHQESAPQDGVNWANQVGLSGATTFYGQVSISTTSHTVQGAVNLARNLVTVPQVTAVKIFGEDTTALTAILQKLR